MCYDIYAEKGPKTNTYGMILVFIKKSYPYKENSLEYGGYYPTLGSRCVWVYSF